MRRFPTLLYRIQRWRWSLSHPLTVGVRLLPIQGETILLVRHTYQNHWYIPGGGVRKRETLEEALRREAQEELGIFSGNIDKMLSIRAFFYHGGHRVFLFFSAIGHKTLWSLMFSVVKMTDNGMFAPIY